MVEVAEAAYSLAIDNPTDRRGPQSDGNGCDCSKRRREKGDGQQFRYLSADLLEIECLNVGDE